ncbi:efflux RND transporter periplasmic adaptor subunit [Marivirga atlantica]|jgi:HlyD family secretion protein|uniref:HlyD family efflux transporter periplasmic adaptor subunit n=1 Tax=Marivirga atlantica TaxID=1548457 RepID=A0A937DLA6_9BACT|nr:HlyD family efflux transporter periplasmic adaptor subunit [Marivirga atlantica]MBL0767076.1 HlyD family efflux transporter periplasmic adaptor subunit [Marivirga atlantica]
MDKKIEQKRWTTKKILTIGLGVVIISFVVYQLLFADNRSTLNVKKDRLTIATVQNGEFKDFIPVTGNVEPGETFYLDAIEGGIIASIMKESGAQVKQGDTILTLTNSNLQLEVMQRETQLYEQINNLRQTRLLLDQNDLSQQAQLAEIDYQLNLLQPQYQRFKKLFEQKLISEREFEEVKENYDYNRKRKELTYTSYRNDSIARVFQLRQLNNSESRMQRSLDAVGNILDNLTLKATRNGQLSTPQLEVGQSVTSGQRLGQIDVMNNYKIRVAIDELYLPRVDVGQSGTFNFSGDSYSVTINKIYPTISNGRFEVDMIFEGESPQGIKRGQTVRIRLELGAAEETLLLPVGGFYKDTGGNWAYVVSESDNQVAYKQEIRLGRKNAEYYEVLDGLEVGDKVVISGYDNYGDNEVLNLN